MTAIAIRATRAFWVGPRLVAVGEVVELPAVDAVGVVGTGRAEYAEPGAAEGPAAEALRRDLAAALKRRQFQPPPQMSDFGFRKL